MKSFNKLWLFALIFIAGLYPLYLYSNLLMENRISLTMTQRTNYIRQQLDIGFSYIRSQKKQIETNIALARKQMLFHPGVKQLKNFPGINAYGLSGNEVFPGKLALNLNITGIGNLSDMRPAVKEEIHAAMSLNLYPPTKDSSYDFVWSYYTSKNKFMALSPKILISDFNFEVDIYKKPFWTIATPKSNPQKRIVISPLYEDAAGMGKMISISNPVYDNDQFIGVISLDVGLDRLRQGLKFGLKNIPGTSILFDEEGQIIATSNSSGYINITSQYKSLISQQKGLNSIGNNVFYSQEIIKDELYITQKISKLALLKSISLSMISFTLIFLFILVISYLVMHLYNLLKKVKSLASTDGLTKLYNRRAFFELAIKSMSSAIRNQRTISLMILDVDLFKKINDNYGHSVGDEALVFLSGIIIKSVRQSDIVCRYGGEEFIVLLPESDLQGAFSTAEKIRKNLEGSTFSKHQITMNISAGCAEFQLPKETLESMIDRADKALYQAKNSGRNKVVMA